MSDIKKTTLHVYDESTKTFKIVHPETETSQIPDLDTYIEKAMAANDAKEQQADWNVTDTTSKAFIKNKPENLINIGNSPKFDLVSFYKEDNSGHPNYFLMHELVQYNPDKLTYPISAVYGFNGMVFGEPRIGNDGSQFLVFAKIDLGYEDISLYSSSTHYSPVVLKDETNNKYYWAMRINGSYQRVYMLGTFTAPPLKTAILAIDSSGTLPSGWSLVHTAKPYPLDNTSVFKAERDANGDKIDTTYEKVADASNVHTSLQNSINTKQDKLTFDATPTADSTNPVTSKGVKSYVDSLSDSVWHNSKKLNPTDNLNNIKEEGIYYQNEFVGSVTTLNYPSIANNFGMGILLVFKNPGSGSTLNNRDGYIQLFYPKIGNNCYQRSYFSKTNISASTWTPWLSMRSADTAAKLATARTISLTGDASGSVTFDGSEDVNISTTVNESKHATAADSATIAVSDGNGNVIVDTYATKTALSTKQEKLSFDTTPTADSQNPVTSDGIKKAIDDAVENSVKYEGNVLTGVIKAGKIVAPSEQHGLTAPTPGVVLEDSSSNIKYGSIDIRALGEGNGKISFSFYEQGGPQLSSYTLDESGNFSGNAATATKLSTARTIQTNLANTKSATFDGSTNVTPGVSGILPVTNGGTGATNLDNVTVGTAKKVHTSVPRGAVGELVKAGVADNDSFRIAVGGSTNNGWAELATADDGTEPIYVRQYADSKSDNFVTPIRTATLLDAEGNTSFPGKVTAPIFSGSLNGNANTATKLQTARTINFNGALDGNVTFDGSKNVSVTLSEFDHIEAIIDLTDATKYDTDTYYPVVSDVYWNNAEHKYRCWTPIHTVNTAPWGTLGTGDYSAELKVRNNMDGWGAQKAYAEILMNSCLCVNGEMPITYLQMTHCGRSVFFVRGGGKYRFSSTRNAIWELKTDTFTENYDTVAPTKTYFTPESKNTIKTVGINISGNATSATKATSDGNGANIANTYLKKAGDTTTGKITFASTDLNALPEVKKTSDDNMSGVRFSSKTKFLGAVGKRLSNGEDLLNLRSDNSTTDVVLDSRNYNNYAPTKTGDGASGTWGINITGTATKATQDASGNVITNTYATKTEVSNSKVAAGSISSTNGTIAVLDGAGNKLTFSGNLRDYCLQNATSYSPDTSGIVTLKSVNAYDSTKVNSTKITNVALKTVQDSQGTSISTLQSNVSSLQTTVNSNKSRLDADEKTIAGHTTTISTLATQSALNAHMGDANAHSNRLSVTTTSTEPSLATNGLWFHVTSDTGTESSGGTASLSNFLDGCTETGTISRKNSDGVCVIFHPETEISQVVGLQNSLNSKADSSVLNSYAKKSDVQTALTFDAAPTSGSTNPVTSGGVKTYVDNINTSLNNKISSIPKFSISVVTTLPTTGISNTTIYLVKTNSTTQNLYTEYIYINSAWEKLGEQTIDLSQYYTKTETTNAINSKAASYLPLAGGTMTGGINFKKSTYTLNSDTDGNLTWTGTTFSAPKVLNAYYNDYAEYFPKGEETEAGDIISLDLSSDTEQYVKADTEKNHAVVGVHSDTYGHILGGINPPSDFIGTFEEYNNKYYIPIALSGRVYVKVKGIVHKGEYITISDIPGIGKAEEFAGATSSSYIVGMALENKYTEDIDKVRIKVK